MLDNTYTHACMPPPSWLVPPRTPWWCAPPCGVVRCGVVGIRLLGGVGVMTMIVMMIIIILFAS